MDGSGQVSIRGNGNVLILVDGVPTTLDGLGSIPAANVQSIDIVTSPDAKYGFNNFMRSAEGRLLPGGRKNGNVAMRYNVGRWGIRLNYNGRYEKDKERWMDKQQ